MSPRTHRLLVLAAVLGQTACPADPAGDAPLSTGASLASSADSGDESYTSSEVGSQSGGGGESDSDVDYCGDLPPSQTAVNLGVVPMQQACQQWCWAAGVSMVAQYYSAPGATQCVLASGLNGDLVNCCGYGACAVNDCNMAASADEIALAFQDVGIHGVQEASAISETQLQVEISNGRPVLVGLVNSFSGHVAVVDAFDPALGRYHFIDPYYGEYSVPYDEILNGYGFGVTWGVTWYRLSPRIDGCNNEFDPSCGCEASDTAESDTGGTSGDSPLLGGRCLQACVTADDCLQQAECVDGHCQPADCTTTGCALGGVCVHDQAANLNSCAQPCGELGDCPTSFECTEYGACEQSPCGGTSDCAEYQPFGYENTFCVPLAHGISGDCQIACSDDQDCPALTLGMARAPGICADGYCQYGCTQAYCEQFAELILDAPDAEFDCQ